MSSIIKGNISLSVYGESHNPTMGIVIDGLPAGISIDKSLIDNELKKRRPQNEMSTARVELDEYEFISGYFNDKTTGAPLCIQVKNNNYNSNNYKRGDVRPSQSDYSAYLKYNGFNDYRGGGHLSGRLTVLYVIAGAICKQILTKKGIKIASHVKQIKDLVDDDFDTNDLTKQMLYLHQQAFPVLNENTKEKMEKLIKDVAKNNDSVGGIIETVIYPMPAKIGEPLFDSLESQISRYIFAIPAIKGISFGLGFDYIYETGKSANDIWTIKDRHYQTITNHDGGINGGISNGMPITFKVIVKPTPSIKQVQDSINILEGKETKIEIEGAHDPAIVARCSVVIEAMTAFSLLDLIISQDGKGWIS